MKSDWKRNYSITITPNNLLESVARINRTIRESIDFRIKTDRGDGVYAFCGPLMALVTNCSVDNDFNLILQCRGREIGFMLIDEDAPIVFIISGVGIDAEGSPDYSKAIIEFCDTVNDPMSLIERKMV